MYTLKLEIVEKSNPTGKFCYISEFSMPKPYRRSKQTLNLKYDACQTNEALNSASMPSMKDFFNGVLEMPFVLWQIILIT